MDELILGDGGLGEEHEVGTGNLERAGKTGGACEPTGVTTHDLDERHGLQVVYVGVAKHLGHGRCDELGRRAEPGRMVRTHEVVVDGLGHTHEADGRADRVTVERELVNSVHRIVAADVEHRSNTQLTKDVHELPIGRLVLLHVGKLVATGAEPARGSHLEELGVKRTRKVVREANGATLEKALNTVAHADDVEPERVRRGNDARQARVDGGGGTARLTDQDLVTICHELPSPHATVIASTEVTPSVEACGGDQATSGGYPLPVHVGSQSPYAR